MRKLGLIVIAVLVLLTLSVPVVATAEVVTPYQYATDFAGAFPARSVLSGNEMLSSEYLVTFLESVGYVVETPEFTYRYSSSSSSATVTCKYRHVLGFKDNGKGKKVVVGAYYGGFDAEAGLTAGEGAEVALSVGALQYIAAALFADFTEYDLVIAFWGGVSVADFNVSKCGVDPSEIALYVNLDGVAAGTYDYYYCDDVPRSHNDYFKGVIESLGANILPPPVFKRTTLLSVAGGSYSTGHLGLFSTNSYFLNEDVPCISFLGGAWTYDAGIYHYEGKGEISGTSLDTFETVNTRNGGREATEKRLLDVSNVIVTALRGEGLSSALDAAAKDLSGADLDSSLAYYLITFIGAGVIIALFVLLILSRGKDRREEVWEAEPSSEEVPPQAPPTAENPFREFESEEKPAQNGRNEDDDVFRF